MTKQGAWSVFPFQRLIVAQLIVAAAAVSLGGLVGSDAARSALAGAVICGVANVYAVWRVFGARRDPASEHAELANLYRAELGKLLIIGALTAALFSAIEVHILAYIGGCLGVLLTGIGVAATFSPVTASTRNTKLQDNHGERDVN